MREEIATFVHPVFSYGLSLKERLDLGERPDFDKEQAALKGLLGSENEARRFQEFGGDQSVSLDQSIMASMRAGDVGRRGQDQFLGIRYALSCWLDEIFVLDPAWGSEWNERKIETSLYGTNERGWKFWDQARRAESRPGSDALEVYFLAVMLGFRGELRERPEELARWVTATQGRIAKSQGKEWPGPPGKDLIGDAAPRHGLERVQKMVLIVGVALLAIIPLVAFLVMRKVIQWN